MIWDVPAIGALPGPGFHWDSAFLCDVTICAKDCKIEVPHAQGGLVPGDGMGLMFSSATWAPSAATTT